MEMPGEIKNIMQKIKEAHFDAYLVGGCVRDLILGRGVRDWDITTNATPEQIQKVFSESFYENKFGTVSVITDSVDESLKVVEITPFRLEGKYSDKRHPDEIKFAQRLDDDLARRDFTINALALSVAAGMAPKTIDLFGGQEDLKNKIIRTVGNSEERFNEDALRLMRAIRFATELEFEIEENTQKAIKKLAATLEFISKERIRDEFIKILMAGKAAWGVEFLEKLGLLKYVLPELIEGVGVVGVTKKKKGHIKYDELSVFEHHLKTLDYAAQQKFNLEVRLASLLHDLGKPRTKKGEGLEATFKAHEQVGARMAIQALERLHFSKKIIEKTVSLVRWHFFFYNVDEVTEAGVRRLIRRVGPENIQDLLSLREADRSGSGLPKISSYRLKHLRYMIERVSRDAIHPKMLKIHGNDVMEILKIAPGPKVGWMLNALLEEVLDEPKKNQEKYLIARLKELGDLPGEELKKLSQEAITKKEELEEEIDESMKRKYNV
jgi:putative nucleotidyltransferase with HDIG domain